MSLAVDAAICIFCFGAAVSYVITCGDILHPVSICFLLSILLVVVLSCFVVVSLSSFSFLLRRAHLTCSLSHFSLSHTAPRFRCQVAAHFLGGDSLFAHPPAIMTVCTFALMLPFSLVDKISALRFTSALGVGAVVFLVFATTIVCAGDLCR
jgi:amino acid permease